MFHKTGLKKYRLSLLLSRVWAAAGFPVFLLIGRVPPASWFAWSGEGAAPLFWGTCAAHFAAAWFLIANRRLPYADNPGVLLATVLTLSAGLLLFLAAAGQAAFLCFAPLFLAFETAWFGLDLAFRKRFVRYRFLLFPSTVPLSPEAFPEDEVVVPDSPGRLAEDGWDAVVADPAAPYGAAWREALDDCRNAGVPVIPLAPFLEAAWGRVPLELTDPAPAVPAGGAYRLPKGIAEWCLAALGLVLTAPLMAAAAVLVHCTSRGSALFRQRRVGLDGRPFTILKFRTMHDEPAGGGPTRIGGILRKYHIDELPQLLNVIKGDMALVGPRPETSGLTERYTGLIPGYRLRTAVRPGVTSWALIHQGNVSGVPATRVKLSYDLFYLKHVSPHLDLYILLNTVLVMLFGIETLSSPTHLRGLGKRPPRTSG